MNKHFISLILNINIYTSTVKLRHFELDGTILKLLDIQVFEILRVKYF